MPDQDEQRDRAHQSQDREEDEGRRDLPGRWGKRRYLDMSKLGEMDELKGKAEGKKRTGPRTAKSICERILTIPNSRSTTIRRSWHKYHSSLFQPLRTSRNEESKQICQLSNQLDVLFFLWQFPNVKTTKQ